MGGTRADGRLDEQGLKEALYRETADLVALHGAPGHEQDVVRRLVERLRRSAEHVELDAMGNVYVRVDGAAPGPALMLSAHSDEIGCLVTAVDPHGFLRIQRLGGMVESLLVGRTVWVAGHLGVVGTRPGHGQSEADRLRVPPIQDLYVDVGARSAGEVRRMGIDVGSPVTYAAELRRFTNPDLICGKALDNRLACALLIVLLEHLRDAPPPVPLHVVVTVQEEVGLRGARVAAARLQPAAALVIDTVPCGDTPDTAGRGDLPVGIGRGPVIRVASRGDITHPGMRRLLMETAATEDVPHQLLVDLKSTTDASAVHLEGGGIPTGIVNIPRRYSHSPVEVADLNDLVAAFRLVQAVVRRAGSLESYLSFLD